MLLCILSLLTLESDTWRYMLSWLVLFLYVCEDLPGFRMFHGFRCWYGMIVLIGQQARLKKN